MSAAMAPTQPDPWDSFWDDAEIINGGGQEDHQLITVAVNYKEWDEYHQVIQSFFSLGMNLFQGHVKKGTTPLSCITLGSNVVGIRRTPAGKWNAIWQQTVGACHIPTTINWASSMGEKCPPLAIMDTRTCKNPRDFRVWLNYVASMILQTTKKQLLDAIHPDNWVPDVRRAVQTALDIHLIGTSEVMLCEDLPSLPWRQMKTLNTYQVRVLQSGTPSGHISLGLRGGSWVYGASIPQAMLNFKHKDPGTSGITYHREAMKHAEHFYTLKIYEWLLDWNRDPK